MRKTLLGMALAFIAATMALAPAANAGYGHRSHGYKHVYAYKHFHAYKPVHHFYAYRSHYKYVPACSSYGWVYKHGYKQWACIW